MSTEQIPYFQPGSDAPLIFRSRDMNRIVTVCNAVKRMTAVEGDENKVMVTDDIIIIQFKKQDLNTNSSPSTTSGANRYRLKSVQANYLTCRPWDGATELATDVLIAKPYQLRESLPSPRAEGGTSYTLTYAAGIDSDNRKRLKTTGGITETQVVAPVWVVNDEIYSIDADSGVVDGSGNPITRLMNCEARQWTTIS